jgi:hypothetical protein
MWSPAPSGATFAGGRALQNSLFFGSDDTVVQQSAILGEIAENKSLTASIFLLLWKYRKHEALGKDRCNGCIRKESRPRVDGQFYERFRACCQTAGLLRPNLLFVKDVVRNATSAARARKKVCC